MCLLVLELQSDAGFVRKDEAWLPCLCCEDSGIVDGSSMRHAMVCNVLTTHRTPTLNLSDRRVPEACPQEP